MRVSVILRQLGTTPNCRHSAQKPNHSGALQIAGGLAFSEIRGYEQWPVVGPSLTEATNVIRVIVANPVMIKAYQEGVPGNGKALPRRLQDCEAGVEAEKDNGSAFFGEHAGYRARHLAQVEFIVKDSKRFSDTHGWRYAMFDYDLCLAKILFGPNILCFL